LAAAVAEQGVAGLLQQGVYQTVFQGLLKPDF